VQAAAVRVLERKKEPHVSWRGCFFSEMRTVATNDRRVKRRLVLDPDMPGSLPAPVVPTSPWAATGSRKSLRKSVALDEYLLHSLRSDVVTAKAEKRLRRTDVDLGAFALIYVRSAAARVWEAWEKGEHHFEWTADDGGRFCLRSWRENRLVWQQ